MTFKVAAIIRGTRIDVATGFYDAEDIGEIDVLETCDLTDDGFPEHLMGMLGHTKRLHLDAYVQYPDAITHETLVEIG